MFIFNI